MSSGNQDTRNHTIDDVEALIGRFRDCSRESLACGLAVITKCHDLDPERVAGLLKQFESHDQLISAIREQRA